MMGQSNLLHCSLPSLKSYFHLTLHTQLSNPLANRYHTQKNTFATPNSSMVDPQEEEKVKYNTNCPITSYNITLKNFES
ncbi:hypothetical protein EUGRSUZ_H04020 [Eucalyptus grandis]|uniref:Uncharacterized protein n=2 Tax=Eucalyptus grandis TaxID=71139 RepID=A0ACC3JVJ3_EUCGR|nr:hypothetical protein EUGRSUZ_H04020 [Eucalyptus grandis]